MRESFKPTTRQGISYVAMFVIGSTLHTQGTQPAAQDTWLSVVLALGISIPVMLIYSRILTLYPDMSLYDIFYKLLGRAGGAILTVIFILFFLYIEVLIVQMFVQFNRVNILPNTPYFVLALPICLLGSWLSSLGHIKLGKVAATLIFFIVAALLLTFIASIVAFDFSALSPLLEAEPAVLADSSLSYFSVPFTQTLVFLCFFNNVPDGKMRRRSLVWGIVIGGIFILSSILRSTLVLGGTALSQLYYTSFLSASVIRIDSFIQRIETIVSLAFLITALIKISAYCYAAKEGVIKLFPKLNVSWLVLPTAVLVAVAAAAILPTTEQSFWWSELMSRYMLIFQVAIPIILWIVGEVLKLTSKRRERKI